MGNYLRSFRGGVPQCAQLAALRPTGALLVDMDCGSIGVLVLSSLVSALVLAAYEEQSAVLIGNLIVRMGLVYYLNLIHR